MTRPPHPETALGPFIRAQRELMSLSLRTVAQAARVSNPYLSQVERGLYRPSAHVLKGIADALDISAETLYERAGLLDPDARRSVARPGVEEAIRCDAVLSNDQKQALLEVYRGFTGRRGSRRAAGASTKRTAG